MGKENKNQQNLALSDDPSSDSEKSEFEAENNFVEIVLNWEKATKKFEEEEKLNANQSGNNHIKNN